MQHLEEFLKENEFIYTIDNNIYNELLHKYSHGKDSYINKYDDYNVIQI